MICIFATLFQRKSPLRFVASWVSAGIRGRVGEEGDGVKRSLFSDGEKTKPGNEFGTLMLKKKSVMMDV